MTGSVATGKRTLARPRPLLLLLESWTLELELLLEEEDEEPKDLRGFLAVVGDF